MNHKDDEEVRRKADRFLGQKGGRVRLRKDRCRDEEKDGGKLGLRKMRSLMDQAG